MNALTIREKYIFHKNMHLSTNEKCSIFEVFFSLFGRPLGPMSEIPSKFTESAWIFLYDLFMYQAFTWGHFLKIKIERKIFV